MILVIVLAAKTEVTVLLVLAGVAVAVRGMEWAGQPKWVAVAVAVAPGMRQVKTAVGQ